MDSWTLTSIADMQNWKKMAWNFKVRDSELMIYTSDVLILNWPVGHIVENYQGIDDFAHTVKPKPKMLMRFERIVSKLVLLKAIIK